MDSHHIVISYLALQHEQNLPLNENHTMSPGQVLDDEADGARGEGASGGGSEEPLLPRGRGDEVAAEGLQAAYYGGESQPIRLALKV